MNQELLGGIYTIAGGVILYSLKEVVRFFIDSNLSKTKLNLETIYPIYVECFKKAKMMIGSYIIPTETNNFPDSFDVEVYENLDTLEKETYETLLSYRQYLNLFTHVQKMKNFKRDFNNEYSVNQIFFNGEFVAETVEIVQEFESDISYLDNQLEYMAQENEEVDINNIITKAYKDKIMKYEIYLNKFEKEFKTKFKI